MRPRPYRLDPPSLRNRLAAGWIVAGAPLQRVHFGVFARWARLAARIATPGSTCRVWLDDRTEFEVRLTDFYWNRLLAAAYRYEPEIDAILRRFQPLGYGFLDCGANFGYWSLLASGMGYPVVAVEALPSTHACLRRNVALNGREIVTVLGAITGESGQRITVYERGSHAGASVHEHWLGNAGAISEAAEVETVTLDGLAGQYGLLARPLIVKLDVEGMELAALGGGRAVLAAGALVIYEDSGEDRASKVTAGVLRDFHLAVYAPGPAGGVVRVASAEAATRLKPSRKLGYNFFATLPGSPFDLQLGRMVTG